ncbi:hypothetical protein IQ215_11635 [Cyanobacterium stanieri LEGE 03274]|uniref:Uncharacterized protein n=1 Tax=Cyanobacterium stanieri LEGE 03274 TaxID=1828756 RepID=A0ABR9V620_9CHRO|nr:hypothetical protein [Cyanobacterium stanieri]MBE9223349.1 hypothetical protein [Cyanobacterium stanieri LEGE 03274]
MNSTDFPEANHPLIYPLLQIDDVILLELLQTHLDKGKYLVSLFCRHYSKINDVIVGFYEAEDLTYFSFQVWREISYFLFNLNLDKSNKQDEQFYENIIIEYAIDYLQKEDRKEFKNNEISLDIRYFPLHFYLEQSINLLSPKERLIMVTRDKFAWQEEQIINYLKAEGNNISSEDIEDLYHYAHKQLLKLIPLDIRLIYLDKRNSIITGK